MLIALSKAVSSRTARRAVSASHPLSTILTKKFRFLRDNTVRNRRNLSLGTEEEANEIINSIKNESALPSVVYLYDDAGSNLFEDITNTKEYYLTSTELSILQDNAYHMARYKDEGHFSSRGFKNSLIELGAGSGKKIHPLLDALQGISKSAKAKCSYVPADYSGSALEENVQVYNKNRKNIEYFQGTHEEALSSLSTRPGRKTWAYLGSSLGNYLDPVPFLKNLAAHCGPRDRVLLGIDLATKEGGKPVQVINAAYNDSGGVTSRFILNSLSVVNEVAGLDFDEDKFRLVSEYNHEKDAVEMFAECTVACRVTANNGEELVRSLKPGDSIFIEQSGKFTETKIQNMIEHANFMQTRRWSDEKGYFSIIELGPNLPRHATKLSEFIFKDLVGTEKLFHQPLLLRNSFAFYWGLLTAFTDRVALQLPGRDNERLIFEQVADKPTSIHRHSPIFQSWPTSKEIETYSNQVAAALCDKISAEGVTREILLSLEHAEMLHETLMHTLIHSSEKREKKNPLVHPFSEFTLPPTTKRTALSEVSVRIASSQVHLGASPEQEAAAGFVWDNELPRRKATVDSFKCAVCPITNAEFSEFVGDGGYTKSNFWDDNEVNQKVVASNGTGGWDWICREGLERPLFWESSGIRTLNGVVPYQDAGDWPVVISLFEAAAYCQWRGNGARIMTEPEYHALFSGEEDYNDAARRGNNNWQYQGVVSVGTMNDANNKGIRDLVGNGWEWTSTVFDSFKGFKPLYDYQEYSAAFIDGTHFVLKGASPFTGTLVQRMSFRNWYQPNYRYPIAKFRVVE